MEEQGGGRRDHFPVKERRSSGGIARVCESSEQEVVRWVPEGGAERADLRNQVEAGKERSPEESWTQEEPENGGTLGWVTRDQRYIPYVLEEAL